jgi:hypothetical protein
MNLYYLSQDDERGYDTYDSCIVAAETEEEARLIRPGYGDWGERYGTWARKPEYVKVELIGTAVKGTRAGVVLASFNAG